MCMMAVLMGSEILSVDWSGIPQVHPNEALTRAIISSSPYLTRPHPPSWSRWGVACCCSRGGLSGRCW